MGQSGGGLLGGGSAFPGISVGGAAPSQQRMKNPGIGGAGGSGNGGGGGPQTTMGKVILDNANAFKKFAQEGSAASKVMTEALKRDISEQERSLDKLRDKLSGLGEEFDLATRKQKEFLAAGNSGGAAAMGKHISSLSAQIAANSGMALQGSNALGASQAALGAATGPTGGFLGSGVGLGQAFGSAMSGGGLGGLAAIAAKLAPLAMIASGAKAIYNEVREGDGGMDSRAFARRGDLVNSRIAALKGGDVSSLILQKYIRGSSPEMSAYYSQATDAASQAEAILKGGKQAAGKIPLLGSVTSFLGITENDPNGRTMLESMTSSEIQSKIMEKVQEKEAEFSRHADYQTKARAYNYFQSTFGARVNARRVLGATTDGFYVNSKGERVKTSTFGDLQASADSELLDTGAITGAFSNARMIGGSSFGHAIKKYAALSAAGGYAGFEQMAAMANRGVASGAEAVQLARAALGGGIGAGAGMQLGSQIFGYDPMGQTSGAGLLGAIQTGVGDFSKMSGGAQFNKVQSLGAAQGALNAVMSGGLDPSTLGSNTLNAMSILGSGASSRAVDYLGSKMNLKQMVDIGFGREKGTKEMGVYGINSDQVRSAAIKNISSLLNAELDDPNTGGAVSKFQAALASGVSPKDAFAALSESERNAVDVAFGNRTGVGGAVGGSISSILSGLDSSLAGGKKLKRGDALGAGLTGELKAEAERKTLEGRQEETGVQGLGLGGKGGLISQAESAAIAFGNWGTNLSKSTSTLVEQLDLLAGAINKINVSMGGKKIESKSKVVAKQEQQNAARPANGGL